jgi:hypothetical protein
MSARVRACPWQQPCQLCCIALHEPTAARLRVCALVRGSSPVSCGGSLYTSSVLETSLHWHDDFVQGNDPQPFPPDPYPDLSVQPVRHKLHYTYPTNFRAPARHFPDWGVQRMQKRGLGFLARQGKVPNILAGRNACKCRQK